ncbi:HEPN domain-containing protein [Kocuria rhizophila]|uniref:HEPN domain-containing protein n=1 Tax=Kocuria rhizophila TaxID=72000 RepID=UPI001EF54215|nr:HEPN domain-containing protein [Kocuria rhizophila]MCG7425190.1 HEPN domain-containing protein [Kocuria rhizophila]MDN3225626.1 HEPN domain-containing protein [Kocuria rhizophila]
MTSDARNQLLTALNAVEAACDEECVKNKDPEGQILRKGLCVTSFNVLEGFVAQRWEELAVYANGGVTQFDDLPEEMRRKILERTLKVAARRLGRIDKDDASLTLFMKNIGLSLSKTSGDLILSDLAGKWEGSNLNSTDLADILKMLHVGNPWESMRELTARFWSSTVNTDNTPSIDLAQTFRTISQNRHNAAHDMNYNATLLQLRTLPSEIRKISFGFDVCASKAIEHLRSGNQYYLRDANYIGSNDLTEYWVIEESEDKFITYFQGTDDPQYDEGAQDRYENSLRSIRQRGKAHHPVIHLNAAGHVMDWTILGPG